MVQQVFSFFILLLQDEFDTYGITFYLIWLERIDPFHFYWKQKVHLLRVLDPSDILKKQPQTCPNVSSANSHLCGFRKSVGIITTVVNGWKLLAIAIKSPSLDIGRVSGSTAGRKWNTGLDLKLKFTMLSITHLKKEGQHQLLERVSTD